MKQPSSDHRTYRALGVTFAVLGLVLLLTRDSRSVGLPFLVMGATFFAYSYRLPRR